MSALMKRLGPQVGLMSGFALWLVAFVVVGANSPTAGDAIAPRDIPAIERESSQSQQPAPAPADFIGQAACLSCHDKEGETYGKSNHHRVGDPRTPAAAQSCETCHGAGRKHAEADDPATVPMKNFKTLPADEVNETCASCHNKGEHALWQGSQHEARGVSCVTLPQPARRQVGNQAAQGQDADGDLRDVSSREGRQARSLGAHARARRQDGVHHVPQRARVDQRTPPPQGRLDCRTLHVLSRGQARAVPLGACPRARRLCDLPRRARLVQRTHARGEAADPVSAVPRRHAAPEHDLRRGAVGTSIRVYARSCVTCHAKIHGSNHPNGQRFVR